MKIEISQQALSWFETEMEATEGEWIQFYARYGGSSKLHEGFTLGMTKAEPDEAAVQQDENGIHFYIEERDLWYFDGHDLHVELHPERQEITFDYKKSS
ncbi:HesB/YadR/YfhF family protein [Chryseomicrobium sp. FSL W7-1435]|uniref:HesB/YadR/YfhF family protein n=1 Tax=Chryseomicrobium sp. FSL W7-1435 TaxID=2921704 RepID=UPI0031599818